ncbi:uncharacterized protein V6R79_005649 [Siganus canaliculatus]
MAETEPAALHLCLLIVRDPQDRMVINIIAGFLLDGMTGTIHLVRLLPHIIVGTIVQREIEITTSPTGFPIAVTPTDPDPTLPRMALLHLDTILAKPIAGIDNHHNGRGVIMSASKQIPLLGETGGSRF